MSGIQKPTRRYHKKSRTGCSECRSRRIKCDERRPGCHNCERASLTCHYTAQAKLEQSISPSPGNSIPQSTPSVAPESCATVSFDMLDLGLIHHYTTITSTSLFGEDQRELWQIEVPMMARSSSLLMHGLLATAALHMAFLHKDDPSRGSYSRRALYHHGLGLQLFNTNITTLSNEDSNSHVLFTFGLFLVIWAYASPTIPSPGDAEAENEHLDLDTLVSSLDLVRGNKVIFELSSETILSQPIGAFTQPSTKFVSSRTRSSPSNHSLSSSTQEALLNLRKTVTDFIDTTAIDHLERFLLDTISNSARDMRIPLGWPALIETPFWERVKGYKPPALLILMHYAVLLACYEDRMWWMEGWSKRLVNAVSQVLEGIDGAKYEWGITCGVVMNLVDKVKNEIA